MPTTKQPAGAENAGPLEHSEVVDTADSTGRAAAPELKGKRVRAIPGGGGTTVELSARDFATLGVKHGPVQWDFRKDRFTVAVGSKSGQISSEAADALTKEFPESFEYIGG